MLLADYEPIGGPPADAAQRQGQLGEEGHHQETWQYAILKNEYNFKKMPHTGDTNSLDQCE